jgi:hypothetical protein
VAADCQSGVCAGGVCQAPSCGDGVQNGTETGLDCGGPSCDAAYLLCGVGEGCSTAADCASNVCAAGVCSAATSSGSLYPTPPAGGPTTTWTDCNLADDPSANGGDLSWVTVTPFAWQGCEEAGSSLRSLALGPTADIGLAVQCQWFGHPYGMGVYARLNGSGIPLTSGSYTPVANAADTSVEWSFFTIDPFNDLEAGVFANVPCSPFLGPNCTGGFEYEERLGWGQPGVRGSQACTGGTFGYCSGTFSWSYTPAGAPVSPPSRIPDGAGGRYLFGALPSTRDFGCGPMVPTSSSSGFVVHLGPTSCLYGHVLPVVAAVGADPGGATLSAGSTTPLDLGCGPLPAGAGGSTLVTRLDPTGACVYGASVAAPGLAVTDAPDGSAVLSGTVGAVPVDLGGGPMAPLGSNDVVLGELSASGAYLWSRRVGAAGIPFAGPWVTVSAEGNVYLRTGWSGSVDLGGGPIAAASHDTVVASYDPTGALRWARDFPIAGTYQAGVDACGALVAASVDRAFDPGQGPVLPQWPVLMVNTAAAVARFAP